MSNESQTLREQIEQLKRYRMSTHTPEAYYGNNWRPMPVPAMKEDASGDYVLFRDVADRLASLEQQNDLMARQLQGSAYDAKDFMEHIANLEQQVAEWRSRYMDIVKADSADYHDQLTAAHTISAQHKEIDDLKAQLASLAQENEKLKKRGQS